MTIPARCNWIRSFRRRCPASRTFFALGCRSTIVWSPLWHRRRRKHRQRRATQVGTFFSGGVDSFYTLLQHQEEITHLCLIYGMDIPLDDMEYRTGVARRVQEAGRRLGKQVIEVETNITSFMDPFVSPKAGYGVILRTAAMLLDGFEKFYIPSTYSGANLAPDGTHPVLDPLWNTRRLSFVHDGCELTRFRKTEYVSRDPVTYDILRVCWMHSSGKHNCCRCEKCVRTMIALQALDRLDRFSVFPRPLDLSSYPDPGPKPLALLDFYQPMYNYLKDTGKHPQLLKYLAGMLSPPLWRRCYQQYRQWRKCFKRCLCDYARSAFRGSKQEVRAASRAAPDGQEAP